jgi:hypothetical protein
MGTTIRFQVISSGWFHASLEQPKRKRRAPRPVFGRICDLSLAQACAAGKFNVRRLPSEAGEARKLNG